MDSPYKTDNGSLSRRPLRSRHTYNRRGAQVFSAQGGSRWRYFRSNTFWYILAGVTVVIGGLFFLVKDMTVYERAHYVWRQVLERTFFVKESAPVFAEDGTLIVEGEIRYTVPSELVGRESAKPLTPSGVE